MYIPAIFWLVSIEFVQEIFVGFRVIDFPIFCQTMVKIQINGNPGNFWQNRIQNVHEFAHFRVLVDVEIDGAVQNNSGLHNWGKWTQIFPFHKVSK